MLIYKIINNDHSQPFIKELNAEISKGWKISPIQPQVIGKNDEYGGYVYNILIEKETIENKKEDFKNVF